jgi:hypothetical protein
VHAALGRRFLVLLDGHEGLLDSKAWHRGARRQKGWMRADQGPKARSP